MCFDCTSHEFIELTWTMYTVEYGYSVIQKYNVFSNTSPYEKSNCFQVSVDAEFIMSSAKLYSIGIAEKKKCVKKLSQTSNDKHGPNDTQLSLSWI